MQHEGSAQYLAVPELFPVSTGARYVHAGIVGRCDRCETHGRRAFKEPAGRAESMLYRSEG